jgi:hypothetical protein
MRKVTVSKPAMRATVGGRRWPLRLIKTPFISEKSPKVISSYIIDVLKVQRFTPFRIEDAQYATPSSLITAHFVGVSQGSSGTDVPAFVNEKRFNTKTNMVDCFCISGASGAILVSKI